MHSKKAAFACGLSLAAVAILVPLVSRVNHYGINSQPGAGARKLRGDVNPVPPLPPSKGKPGAAETLNADVNPVPPLPPHKKASTGSNIYIVDVNPVPPLPLKGHGKSAGSLV
jgi:hypothetical protein